MHSGYGVPGIQHPQQQQQQQHQAVENSLPGPAFLSMNPHILEQIHCTTLPASNLQQLFFDQHQFVVPPHQARLSHNYVHGGAAGSSSSAFLPVNFKLGLNDICSTRNNYRDAHGTTPSTSVSNNINEVVVGEDAAANLLRGSEQQYQVPEARQYSSLGMLHCWQNQQDYAIKQQQPFWESLPAEASNENSEIVDRQEHIEMSQKEAALNNCLESKSRVDFGELEAIYKRLGTDESNQTGPIERVNPSEASIGEEEQEEEQEQEEASASLKNMRKKRKKKKTYKENQMISPMAEFFEGLVKQVMDHQENLHRKFNEVVERLDEERREREIAWRNQEAARFKQEAAARAREKALVESREATILSYLEKITGQKINFPMFSTPGEINSSSRGDDSRHLVGPMELEQARVDLNSSKFSR